MKGKIQTKRNDDEGEREKIYEVETKEFVGYVIKAR